MLDTTTRAYIISYRNRTLTNIDGFFLKRETFSISEWQKFVTIQMSKWLDMATNWTIHSSPDKVSYNNEYIIIQHSLYAIVVSGKPRIQ